MDCSIRVTGVRWSTKTTTKDLIMGAAIVIGRRSTSPGFTSSVEPSGICSATDALRTTTILRLLAIADVIALYRTGHRFAQPKETAHNTLQCSYVSIHGNGGLEGISPLSSSRNSQRYSILSTPYRYCVDTAWPNSPEQQAVVLSC